MDFLEKPLYLRTTYDSIVDAFGEPNLGGITILYEYYNQMRESGIPEINWKEFNTNVIACWYVYKEDNIIAIIYDSYQGNYLNCNEYDMRKNKQFNIYVNHTIDVNSIIEYITANIYNNYHNVKINHKLV